MIKRVRVYLFLAELNLNMINFFTRLGLDS